MTLKLGFSVFFGNRYNTTNFSLIILFFFQNIIGDERNRLTANPRWLSEVGSYENFRKIHLGDHIHKASKVIARNAAYKSWDFDDSPWKNIR